MKFFISKNKKLPREAQKGLEPSKEFMTQGKERFLAAFDASELARNAHGLRGVVRSGYVTAFFKIGVGVMAVLAVGVGLSAYADTANVAVTSPLYPLKRIGENVQLALAPAPEKPQLQAAFAVRRANEIAALEASAPSSTLIPQLTNNMEQDISASLIASANLNATGTVAVLGPAGTRSVSGKRTARAHNPGNSAGTTTVASTTISAVVTPSSTISTGTIDIYCSAFDVSTSGVLLGRLEDQLSLHPDALLQFNKQCGSESSSTENWRPRRSADGDGATTTILTAPSTTVHVRTHIPQVGL